MSTDKTTNLKQLETGEGSVSEVKFAIVLSMQMCRIEVPVIFGSPLILEGLGSKPF